MQVHALGCSGAIAHGSYTSAFVLDERIALDAGTGLGQLPLERMLALDHIFLTHAHLDHIAALPLFLDSVMPARMQHAKPTPVHVYALPETLYALSKHIFNSVIWPDFTGIPSRQQPILRFVPIAVGQKIQIENLPYVIEALPAAHSVPAVGYAVQADKDSPALVYTGDTAPNPHLWAALRGRAIAALIIETAFSNEDAVVARAAMHLTPHFLLHELAALRAQSGTDLDFPIYITHTKPLQAVRVMEEVAQLQAAQGHARYDIRWLRCGLSFEV